MEEGEKKKRCKQRQSNMLLNIMWLLWDIIHCNFLQNIVKWCSFNCFSLWLFANWKFLKNKKKTKMKTSFFFFFLISCLFNISTSHTKPNHKVNSCATQFKATISLPFVLWVFVDINKTSNKKWKMKKGKQMKKRSRQKKQKLKRSNTTTHDPDFHFAHKI